MPTLFHVVRPTELVWNPGDRYAPPSLEKEGFLHASFAEKVVESAKLYFAKDEFASLRVLVIDPAKLDCEVRIVETPRGPMPHIHGSIPRAAATEMSIQRMPLVSSSANK